MQQVTTCTFEHRFCLSKQQPCLTEVRSCLWCSDVRLAMRYLTARCWLERCALQEWQAAYGCSCHPALLQSLSGAQWPISSPLHQNWLSQDVCLTHQHAPTRWAEGHDLQQNTKSRHTETMVTSVHVMQSQTAKSIQSPKRHRSITATNVRSQWLDLEIQHQDPKLNTANSHVPACGIIRQEQHLQRPQPTLTFVLFKIESIVTQMCKHFGWNRKRWMTFPKFWMMMQYVTGDVLPPWTTQGGLSRFMSPCHWD